MVEKWENYFQLHTLFLGPGHRIQCYLLRVPTRQGKVREICFFFKVREKSVNSVKWSGKLENLQKSGKSQGILKLCLANPSKIEQTDMR